MPFMPFNFSPCVLYRGHIIKYDESLRVESFSKMKCKKKIPSFFFLGGGGGGGGSQEDILGLAISLIFDQFSIL